jgi:hypothetical protein
MMDIDRIARQIVDAEPSADLEARIRARLDQMQTHRRGTSWWRVGALLGATAAVALIVGVLGSRGPGVGTPVGVQGLPAVARSAEVGPGSRVQSPEIGVQGSRGPEVENQPAEVSRTVSAAVQETGSSPFRTLPPLRHSSDAQRAQASALSMEELAWMERRIAALPAVEALRMEHLTYESIQPEALSITPLLMTAMPTDGADIDRQNNR